MNLTEIRRTLYDRLGYDQTATPQAEVVTRLLAFINETQREIVGMRGLSRLRRSVLTFASVASSPFAALPQAAVQIVTIQDRTNGRVLDEVSLQDLRYKDPGLTSSSANPHEYVVANLSSPVARDPSAAATLYAISDNAGDTATAYIEGITTGGYYRTASVVMTGVVGVAFPGADWIAVTKFYISAVAVGVVTLRQTSGVGTELARIPLGRAFSRYSKVQLWPTPTAVVTYHADVLLHIQDMVNAGDEPYLPEDFHWLIVCGALEKEYTKREKPALFAIEHSRWKAGIGDLKVFARQSTGIAQGPNRKGRWSQLGPWFESGT